MARGLKCWTRKTGNGKLYRVCNKSKGQKGVYKKAKKSKTAKKKKGKKGKTAKKRTPLALRRLR